MTRCAIALLSLTAPALADGTATWLWDVATQDGDAIVEPGETATITLLLHMQPHDHPWSAFAATIFDTIGGDGSSNGHIVAWKIHDHFDLAGDTTTTDGVSLFDTQAGQFTVGGGPFNEDNPVDIFSFEWQPDVLDSYEVNYATISDIEGERAVFVWEGTSKYDATGALYPVSDTLITFTVVPAPPTILLFTIFTLPRRRSS